jgi:zinc transport system substrate-binding protein
MKKRIFLLAVFVITLMVLSGCQKPVTQINEEEARIAVSIVPQAAFVDAVGGDLVKVVTMIPPGSSPENYQPVPQQMIELSEASLYFTIGVASEKANILPKLKDLNPDLQVVFLEDIVAERYASRLLDEHHHEEDEAHDDSDGEESHDEAIDPHIWLSPRRVEVMIESIRDELVRMDEENKNQYIENSENYINALKQLDEDIMTAFEDANQKAFIIYHPAYGYFAEDYGLEMITIEENGKTATAERLQYVIDFAKEKGLKVIFYQDEFDSSQAKTIAKEIGGTAISVSPLSYDYMGSMRDIIEKLSEVVN